MKFKFAYMQIKPKQYAKTLYEITEDLEESEIAEVVKDFVELLAKRGDLRYAPQIIEKFDKYLREEEGILAVKVTSSFDLNEKVREGIKNQLLKQYKDYKQVELIENKDKSLIGGLKLEFEDTVIDGSLRNRLEVLREGLRR